MNEDFNKKKIEELTKELLAANKELIFQNEEKEKQAAELLLAYKELILQNEEKEKQAMELLHANKALIVQNQEKEKQAAELLAANKELVFQSKEREKQAAELFLADKELVIQNHEKSLRAAELLIAKNKINSQAELIKIPKTDALETKRIIKRIKNMSLKEKVCNIDISISFGCATKSNEEESIQEIFKNAEDIMYRHKQYESSSIRSKTIDLVMNTLYIKSNREQLHSIKVSEICEAIATKMGFTEKDVYQLKIAGLMHDIGKIEIDEKILNKPEKLSKEEWERMHRHPEIGYRILSSVNEFSWIAGDILEHHERWDGKGYPRRLKGEESSLNARIIAVADAYDAMTTDRVYKKALSKEKAINEIKRCSGTQFDPAIVKIFLEQVVGIQ